jgi:hypothetical protein
VASQALIGTQLTINGTNLPIHTTDVITFGPVICNTDFNISTNTSVVCDLADTITSGEWTVVYVSEHGLLPNEINTTIAVPVSVTAVFPSVDVNFLGGDIMTITGTSFGYDASNITAVWSDGTVCSVKGAAMSSIICINARFTTNATSEQTLTLIVNGVNDTTLSVNLLSQTQGCMSLTPSSASPVLKSEIVVALNSDYSTAMVATDFTAVLFSYNDTTYERELYVMSVDDSAKTLTVKFPGAESGLYYLQVSSI